MGSSDRREPEVTIARVCKMLTTRLEEIPTLDELAAAAGMSRFQLSRMFRQVIGVSLRQYVRDLRLKRACQLLAARNVSITEIALQCGFYDSSHFQKAFRSHFGVTPTQFRQDSKPAGHSGDRRSGQQTDYRSRTTAT